MIKEKQKTHRQRRFSTKGNMNSPVIPVSVSNQIGSLLIRPLKERLLHLHSFLLFLYSPLLLLFCLSTQVFCNGIVEVEGGGGTLIVMTMIVHFIIKICYISLHI